MMTTGFMDLSNVQGKLDENSRANRSTAMAEQTLRIAQAEERRRQEEYDRQQQNQREMQSLAQTLSRGREVTNTFTEPTQPPASIPNPAAQAYDWSQNGAEMLSAAVPSRAEGMAQKDGSLGLSTAQLLDTQTKPADLPQPAVPSMAGLIDKPSESLAQAAPKSITETKMQEYSPQEKYAKMMAGYLERGLINEAAKYGEIGTRADEMARKHATQVYDTYVKMGYNWDATKSVLKMHAPSLGIDPKEVDALEGIIQNGMGGFHTIQVPDANSPTGQRSVLVDAKGKVVTPDSITPAGEKAGAVAKAQETAKQGYRDQQYLQQKELLGIKGAQLEKLAQLRGNIALKLKQTSNATESDVDAITDMYAEGRGPAIFPSSRTITALAATDRALKARGVTVDFNNLQTDKTAQAQVKKQVSIQTYQAKTAERHLDRFQMQYDKMGNTDYPSLNRVVQAFNKGTGDGLGAADAIVYEAMLEYGKVMSGSTTGQALTDTASKKAEMLVNAWSSPERVKQVLEQFKGMMAEKVEEGNKMVASLGGKNSVSGNTPSRPAQTGATPAGATQTAYQGTTPVYKVNGKWQYADGKPYVANK